MQRRLASPGTRAATWRTAARRVRDLTPAVPPAVPRLAAGQVDDNGECRVRRLTAPTNSQVIIQNSYNANDSNTIRSGLKGGERSGGRMRAA